MNKGLIDGRRITRQQLADRLGTSYQAVEKWEREGCPHYHNERAKKKSSKSVRFDVIEVLSWLRARAEDRKIFLAQQRAELRDV